jgi:hypothetical protein
MKKTLKLLGFVALIAAIGFSMTACDDGNGGGGGNITWPGTWTQIEDLAGGSPASAHTFTLNADGTKTDSTIGGETWSTGINMQGNPDLRFQEDGVTIVSLVYERISNTKIKVTSNNLGSSGPNGIYENGGSSGNNNGGNNGGENNNGGNNGGNNNTGNPTWPAELMPVGGSTGTFWGKTTYPDPLNVHFYTASGGSGVASRFGFTGSQLGFQLISIEGKTLKVRCNSSTPVEYTLCTDFTIIDNNLTLTGGDALFSSVMNVSLPRN